MRDREERIFFDPADDAAIVCREIALKKGLIMRAVGSTMVICPPLTISRAEVDELMGIAQQSLDETAAVLASR